MTTRRLYYDDAYTTRFEARVMECAVHGGRMALILDQTYFYPASGGQPADTGQLDGMPVIELAARNGDVLHVLAGESSARAGDVVVGVVDWSRRFDHMQHHTGQHILTQAFVQMCDAQTVGFHLSADSVTIDLDRVSLTGTDVIRAEDLANQIVFENRPVTARLVSPAEASGVRMRKMPGSLLTNGLRVIEIENFDATACGGTHVARTGEIGMIKVLRTEKRGDKLRVEFRCGGRALGDYREKNSIVSRLMADLSCAMDEVVIATARLQSDLKENARQLKAAGGQLLAYEAEALRAAAPVVAGVRLIKRAEAERSSEELRLLASRIVEQPGCLALLATAGEKSFFVLACSADLAYDMNAALKTALSVIGGRGGGQRTLAQGGGTPAELAQIQAALDRVETHLLVG